MGFKKILDYTETELDQAIQNGVNECQKAGMDFYRVLNGIDAYMEKRDRKRKAEAAASQNKPAESKPADPKQAPKPTTPGASAPQKG